METETTIYSPIPALRPFISHYRIWRHKERNGFIDAFKDYPRTAMDMLFFFEGSVDLSVAKHFSYQLSTCTFVGHFDKAYAVIPKGNVSVLNIRFLPNGIYPLTKIPLRLVLNNHIGLEDLVDESVKILHEQLAEQKSDQSRINILEEYLLKRYQHSDLHYRLDYGIQKIQQSKGTISVKELCTHLHTNYKSLNRWFEKGVGFSPKRFIQLTRFKYILDDIEFRPSTDWMQIVENYNFYDQAHFVKEFKQFAGITPTSFLSPSLQDKKDNSQ